MQRDEAVSVVQASARGDIREQKTLGSLGHGLHNVKQCPIGDRNHHETRSNSHWPSKT